MHLASPEIISEQIPKRWFTLLLCKVSGEAALQTYKLKSFHTSKSFALWVEMLKMCGTFHLLQSCVSMRPWLSMHPSPPLPPPLPPSWCWCLQGWRWLRMTARQAPFHLQLIISECSHPSSPPPVKTNENWAQQLLGAWPSARSLWWSCHTLHHSSFFSTFSTQNTPVWIPYVSPSSPTYLCVNPPLPSLRNYFPHPTRIHALLRDIFFITVRFARILYYH